MKNFAGTRNYMRQFFVYGKLIAKALGLTDAEYRKALSMLRAKIAIIENSLREKDYSLPATVYIISDMEFDACADGADITIFEYAKGLFKQHGYKLPNLVFWNVSSRNQQQPVTMNEKGVVLVSGASPRVFSMIASGNLSPYAFMMDTLGAERYARIIA